MVDDNEVILELSMELSSVREKLNEAIKALEWLNGFVKDKLVKELTTTTLRKIKT